MKVFSDERMSASAVIAARHWIMLFRKHELPTLINPMPLGEGVVPEDDDGVVCSNEDRVLRGVDIAAAQP